MPDNQNPIRIPNEALYALLKAEAEQNKRSATKQLEVALEDRYKAQGKI